MRLCSARLVNLPPFDDVRISLCDEHGAPRMVTAFYGGGGVGKTTILNALSQTRPGWAAALGGNPGQDPAFAACEWLLGCDDPERPHPLTVATPTARVEADEQRELLRRREQSLFEKQAREGGFAFMAFSSARWFSRQPIVLSAPGRTTARYDVRAPVSLDDASRSDLARETKQALAYAEITAALSRERETPANFSLFSSAMRHGVDTLVSLSGYRYLGLDPVAFEPLFHGDDGSIVLFDALPTRARHLVAFGALPVRLLWAAYPGRDPLVSAEAVVVIDEVDLHQDVAIQSALVPALRRALPTVQWILTTASPVVAASCEDGEVFALRRLPNTTRVELFTGAEARVH